MLGGKGEAYLLGEGMRPREGRGTGWSQPVRRAKVCPQVCATLGFALSPLQHAELLGGQQRTWEAWPWRCRSEGLRVET